LNPKLKVILALKTEVKIRIKIIKLRKKLKSRKKQRLFAKIKSNTNWAQIPFSSSKRNIVQYFKK
jgi:hypothetical protein